MMQKVVPHTYMSTLRPEGRNELVSAVSWRMGGWVLGSLTVVEEEEEEAACINTNTHTSVKYVMQKRPTSLNTHNLEMASTWPQPCSLGGPVGGS